MVFDAKTFFIMAALVFGLLYAFVNPPLLVPDEAAHLWRAYQVTEGHLLGEPVPPEQACELNCFGGDIPRSLSALWVETAPLAGTDEVTITLAQTRDILDDPLNPDERAFERFAGAATYPPFPYLPVLLVILPLRLLEATPLAMMYAARLANLGVWVGLTAYAIHVMPIKKWFMVLAVLTPMALYIAAGVHVDPFMNAAIYVLFALVLRWMVVDDSRVRIRDAVLVLVLGMMIALAKIAYAPLVGLVLLIPRERFESVWLRWATHVGIPVLGAAATLGWSVLTNAYFSPRHAFVNPGAQLDFVMGHPIAFLQAVGGTLVTRSHVYALQLVGNFGYLNAPIATWVVVVYVVALVFLLVTVDDERQADNFAWPVRLYAAAVAVGTILLIMLGLYMIANPVGGPMVIGVQGRYFLPVLPLAVLLVGNTRLRLPFDARWVAVVVILVIHMAGVYTVAERFYPP